MATMQVFLRQGHGNIEPSDTVVYGPSTANQVDSMNYNKFLVWDNDTCVCLYCACVVYIMKSRSGVIYM